MINWEKELEIIFNDPLLADVTPPRKRTTSSDRLIAGFQEILAFYEANGRMPEDNDSERSLFHKWKGILKKESNIARCRPFDNLGILPQETSQVCEPAFTYQCQSPTDYVLDSILNDPLFDDVSNGGDLGIFDVPEYMRQRLDARKEAEYVGKRRPCDDFDKYADGFKEIQNGLKSGKYHLVKFREQNLKVGRYFIEQGIIGYLAAFENEGKNNLGRVDGRTRVIYENGSEADVKFRTITKNLSVDGYSIVDSVEIPADEFEQCFTISEKDVESGTIYVLRSKSTLPEIANIKNLYKIGFTTTSMESRIANARKEPTYLCADVEVVATWKVYNVKSSTFESLIHKLFGAAQLQLTVDGHRPKEWYIVPFNIIEQAMKYIIKGIPIAYDAQLQMLVL